MVSVGRIVGSGWVELLGVAWKVPVDPGLASFFLKKDQKIKIDNTSIK